MSRFESPGFGKTHYCFNSPALYCSDCHYNKLMPGESMPVGARPDHIGRIFPYWKDNITGGTLVCPESSFRASGDIRNSWQSWFGNLESLIPYQDPDHPISQPNCWAYADM